MKKTLLIFALSPLLLSAQVNPERKTIATLQSGEYIASSESCFFLGKDPEYITFMTYTGSGSSKQYYFYDNKGTKTGPFKSPDPALWAANKDEVVEDCVANKEPRQGNMEQYIDFSTGSVKFKGKTYGPYGQLTTFFLSDDEQNFYATALNEEMKVFFFDNRNRKVELITIPEEVLISPDGSKAYALVKGSFNPFDPKSMEYMMNHPDELNNPPVNLVGIDGKNYGPFTSGDFSGAWFIPSGQLVIYSNKQISLDGNVLFEPREYISKCDLWISRNGKDYAWADYEHLMFSDGTKYPAPMVINYVETGGKGYLKWLSLEDQTRLVYYKRPF